MLAGLVLLLAVTACDDDGGDGAGPETPEPTASASTTASGTPTGTSESTSDVPHRMPAGTLTSRVVVEDRPLRGGLPVDGGAVFTDRYVVTVAASNTLRVFDRDTLAQVWESDLPAPGGSGACPLPRLARDAATVTVFTGGSCERLTTFDLATGQQLADERADVSADYGVLTDGRVVWIDDDGVHVVLPDGTSLILVSAAALGVTGVLESLGGGAVLDGTDQLFLMVSGPRLSITRFVGVRIEDDVVGKVWEVPARRLVPGVRPDTVQAPRTPGGLLYVLDDRREDLAVVGQFAAETGEFSAYRIPVGRERVQFFTPGGEAHLRVVDGTVVTSYGAPDGPGHDHLVRYDLGTGRPLWSTTVPGTEGQRVELFVVGLSSDGLYGYAVAVTSSSAQVVEVDLASGRPTAPAWPFVSALGTPRWFQDGDLLVAVESSQVTPGRQPELEILRVQT